MAELSREQPQVTLNDIARALAGYRPKQFESADPRSAVAIILRNGADGPELLYIRRADDEHDPWSGNIGFPGGRVEKRDHSVRATAERETLEEVGLSLDCACYLGQLDDITGANLPVQVSCFVYALTVDQALVPNDEVAKAFWFPLHELLIPGRHHLASIPFNGTTFYKPALDLLGPEGPVLWGITYRLTEQFLSLIGHPLPPPT